MQGTYLCSNQNPAPSFLKPSLSWGGLINKAARNNLRFWCDDVRVCRVDGCFILAVCAQAFSKKAPAERRSCSAMFKPHTSRQLWCHIASPDKVKPTHGPKQQPSSYIQLQSRLQSHDKKKQKKRSCYKVLFSLALLALKRHWCFVLQVCEDAFLSCTVMWCR